MGFGINFGYTELKIKVPYLSNKFFHLINKVL